MKDKKSMTVPLVKPEKPVIYKNLGSSTVVYGAVGAAAGVAIPIVAKDYLNSEEIVPGFGVWGQKRIFIPLAAGAGSLVAGAVSYRKNINIAALLCSLGITLIVPAVVAGLTSNGSAARLNRSPVRYPCSALRPSPVATVNAGVVSQYSPRPNRTSEESATKITKKVILT
jgi:hypothetical protein